MEVIAFARRSGKTIGSGKFQKRFPRALRAKGQKKVKKVSRGEADVRYLRKRKEGLKEQTIRGRSPTGNNIEQKKLESRPV